MSQHDRRESAESGRAPEAPDVVHSGQRPPPRSRGVIALLADNCTSCMVCARECPDWCIHIDSHTEVTPAGEGGTARPRSRHVLDRFAIDFALCMYCGICVDVCPFDALFWSPDHGYSGGDIGDLVHERDRLGEWLPGVQEGEPSRSAPVERPAPSQ